LDDCRADPWFQSHPDPIDRLEVMLTNFYLGGVARSLSKVVIMGTLTVTW
jgi:hypothetical protein